MKTVFIYGLTCPNTGEFRYIGETRNPTRRKIEHLGRYDKTLCPRTCWISSILDKGHAPGFVIIDEVLEQHRQQLEAAYIQFYREQGCDLVNTTLGGDGVGSGENHPSYGKPRSNETKQKISIALTGKKRSLETCERLRRLATGRMASLLTRAKMSVAHTGKIVSPETRARLSDANKGKPKSSEHRQKLSAANMGEKSFFFGKKRSDETREKMCVAAVLREERKRQAAVLSEMWR